MTVRAGARDTDRFVLFGDCLLVGVCAAVAALGVVTAYPALVAGCVVLRERITVDQPAGPVAFARQLLRVMRGGWAVVVAPVLVAAVLAADAVAVAAGVPGRGALAVLLVLTGSAAVVVGLRAAARWRPGTGWPAVVRAAGADLVADPAGSLLLLFAAGAAVVVAALIPLTALLVTGPLALAAIAVDARPRPTPTDDSPRPAGGVTSTAVRRSRRAPRR